MTLNTLFAWDIFFLFYFFICSSSSIQILCYWDKPYECHLVHDCGGSLNSFKHNSTVLLIILISVASLSCLFSFLWGKLRWCFKLRRWSNYFGNFEKRIEWCCNKIFQRRCEWERRVNLQRVISAISNKKKLFS